MMRKMLFAAVAMLTSSVASAQIEVLTVNSLSANHYEIKNKEEGVSIIGAPSFLELTDLQNRLTIVSMSVDLWIIFNGIGVF